MEAEGSMPSEPVSMEASSDRMSPKMLPVTIVSKALGLRISCMAALSTYLHGGAHIVHMVWQVVCWAIARCSLTRGLFCCAKLLWGEGGAFRWVRGLVHWVGMRVGARV